MNDYNEKEEKKGGFLSALSGLFRGGSSVAGSVSSGMGSAGIGSAGSSAGGLAGLFATKAGIVGMVLGGATIAAGVGVVYNFVGGSSKPVYSPELFQNSYYEEEASRAGLERTQSRDASAAASSTLDMFREQAKKDGLGLGGEGAEGSNANASAEAPATPSDSSADAAAAAPAADSAASGGGAGGGPKLQASSGFGSKGGGGGASGGSSIPRMQSGGGLSGGIGAQFASVYRPPAQANAGKTSGMFASAARVKSSPKYSVPNINKKGAYGQAKFAGKTGAKAAHSVDGAQQSYLAEQSFSGGNSGAGDVGTPGTGAGLGGAGVSNGAGLKGNDPSLSSNESTPPKVPKPEDVDPWQKEEDMAMYGLMGGAVLLMLTNMLSKKAKAALPLAVTPPTVATYLSLRMWTMIAGYATIAAALLAVYAGFVMFTKYDQKMMGGVYMAAGLVLIMKAIEAMSDLPGKEGAGDNKGTLKVTDSKTGKISFIKPGPK
jgi:hypothetical protein